MDRTRVRTATRCEEKSYSDGRLQVRVIEAGVNKGKDRNYGAAMLERDANIFSNSKMFIDHQTKRERNERPEGSVNDWVAVLGEARFDREKNAVVSEATLIDPAFKQKVELLAEQGKLPELGVSIRAYGEGERDENGLVEVTSLVHAMSVDFVTFPGAGGGVEALESFGELPEDSDVNLVTVEQLKDKRPDLVKVLLSESNGGRGTMAKTEQELMQDNANLTSQVATLEAAAATHEQTVKEKDDELAEEAKKNAIAAAGKILEEKLAEWKDGPDQTKDRLREQFKTAEDPAPFDEAIKAEKAYIESLGVKPKAEDKGGKPPSVFDMAEAGNTDTTEEKGGNGKKESPLTPEHFESLGLTEGQAKRAARGW